MTPKMKSLYSPHPSLAMVRKWETELKEKTGRTLEDWLGPVAASGLATEPVRLDWLRREHGLGHNSAGWIAERSLGKGKEFASPDAYLKAAEGWVEKMFSGRKQALRPIYDKLLRLGLSLAKDVKACTCQTIVPLHRHHVFAQIKPTTQTRIDLGFALGPLKADGRPIDTGGFAKKDRITHRIPISSLADIDREVTDWLRAAYGNDASS
jgi:hypothetical protein